MVALPKVDVRCFHHIRAVDQTMIETNKLAVFQIVEASMAEIIHENEKALGSIADIVACAQALILVRFISSSDGGLRQRALAE